MKNINKFAICFALVSVFFACTTTNSSSTSGANNLGFIFSLKLDSDEIYVKDIPQKVEAGYTFSPFHIANNMLSLNTWFEFEKNISLEKQYELAQALFVDLPQIEGEGYLRVVALGKYFHEETNLIVVIDKFKLKEGVVPGCEYGLMYLTNCLDYKTINKETGEQKMVASDSMISKSISYKRIYIPYPNGDLVAVNNLNLENIGMESAKSDVELANLMDTYIKDGIPENDFHVETIYKNIMGRKSDDPYTSILAVMNYGLYQLKLGQYDKAVKLFDTAKLKLPKEADPSFVHAINYDADFLYQMIQALENGNASLMN